MLFCAHVASLNSSPATQELNHNVVYVVHLVCLSSSRAITLARNIINKKNARLHHRRATWAKRKQAPNGTPTGGPQSATSSSLSWVLVADPCALAVTKPKFYSEAARLNGNTHMILHKSRTFDKEVNHNVLRPLNQLRSFEREANSRKPRPCC